MGKPYEKNGATCCVCRKSLPPAKKWKYIKEKKIDGHKTFVFLDGKYYRREGQSHKCPHCFFKPKRDAERRKQEAEKKRREQEKRMKEEKEKKKREEQERKRKEEEQRRRQQEEERKRREVEQKRKTEEARKRQEEKERKLAADKKKKLEEERKRKEAEQKRQQEERKRKEAAKKEAERKRQEELKLAEEKRKKEEEEKRRIEERKRRAKEAADQLDDQLDTFLRKNRTERIHAEISGRDDTLHITRFQKSPKSFSDGEDIRYEEDRALLLELGQTGIELPTEMAVTEETVQILLRQIILEKDVSKWKINEIALTDSGILLDVFEKFLFQDAGKIPELGLRALEWMLVYFFELYGHSVIDNSQNYETTMLDLLGILDAIFRSSSRAEVLELSQTMLLVVKAEHSIVLEKDIIVVTNEQVVIDLVGKIFKYGRELTEQNQDSQDPLWFIPACIHIVKTHQGSSLETSEFDFKKCMCSLVEHEIWHSEDVLEFMRMISNMASTQITVMAGVMELILAYRIPATTQISENHTIIDLISGGDVGTIQNELAKLISTECEKEYVEVLQEITQNKWASEKDVDKIKIVVSNSYTILKTQGFPGDLKKGPEDWKQRLHPNTSLTDMNDNELSEALCTLCCAVKSIEGYWPRATQMISWALLVMAEKSKGRLVEIATGEGKSCIIAMVAATIASHNQTVDIVTSSPMLAARDAEEWSGYYDLFDLKCTHNSHDADVTDKEKKECYRANVIYGTVGSFAADILRQEFEGKDVRGNRGFEAVIVDEVDFMLLDRGVQFTYLSHKSAGLRHLEPVLAMVWSMVSSHTPCVSASSEFFFCGKPKPFYMTTADLLDEDTCQDPMQLLLLAESKGILQEGFTRGILESQNEEVQERIHSITQKQMMSFFSEINDYIPFTVKPFIFGPDGKITSVEEVNAVQSQNLVIPFLIGDKGLCSLLHNDEDILKAAIVEGARAHLQMGPEGDEDDGSKISLPNHLQILAYDRIPIWVENAFNAMRLQKGREYLVKGGQVLPVDYRSTGMVELNKRWGDGLQQFVELKHQLAMSSISLVTNFMSNIAYFQRYAGDIYGVTGTLGSVADQDFLSRQFNVDFCYMPTHRLRKLYEEEGNIFNTESEWLERISQKVKYEVKEKEWGHKGRTALVICEDINSVMKVSNKIKEAGISADLITHYTRSDIDESEALREKFKPGEVIIATNLAGRGTDIKLTEEVNLSGGLYVLVTFLPMNTRIEQQAFGRTGRKGQPGSAQIMLHSNHLQDYLKQAADINRLKILRNNQENSRMKIIEESEVAECILKEDLFKKYKDYQFNIHKEVKANEKVDKIAVKIVIDSLKEHWGMWLQMQSEKIQKLDKESLLSELDSSMKHFQSGIFQEHSVANIYNVIKFGNELIHPEKYEEASKYFDKVIESDDEWATIAYYNRAYCNLEMASKSKKKSDIDDYKQKAAKDLERALETLPKYCTEVIVTKELTDNSWFQKEEDSAEELEAHFTMRTQVLQFFQDKIEEALTELQEIKGNVLVKTNPIFSLIPEADASMEEELQEFWELGLLQVYTVEKKPKFCWQGFLVLVIGIAQVVAGAFIAFASCGTLATFGMSLISEGVSDIYAGIEGMVAGEFDLKSWGIAKVTKICTSIIGGGLAKFAGRAYQLCGKVVGKITSTIAGVLPDKIKVLGQHVINGIEYIYGKTTEGINVAIKKVTEAKNAILERMKIPNMLSRIDGQLDKVFKGDIGRVSKLVTTEFVDQGVNKVFDIVEEKTMQAILKSVQVNLQSKYEHMMKDLVQTGHLSDKIDQIEEHYQSDDKTELILCALGKDVLEPYLSDLADDNEKCSALNDILSDISDELKTNKEISAIFCVFDNIKYAKGAADTAAAIKEMVTDFEDMMITETTSFCDEIGIPEAEISGGREELKLRIAEKLSKTLSQGVTDMIHRKITSRWTDKLAGKVKNAVNGAVTEGLLKKSETEDYLRSSSKYGISLGTEGTITDVIIETVETYVDNHILTHFPKNMMDLEIIANKLMEGTKQVCILSCKRPMMIPPPMGMLPIADVVQMGQCIMQVDNKRVTVDVKENDCMFHVVARGVHPEGSEEELSAYVQKLKSLEEQELQQQPVKWVKFIEWNHWQKQLRETDRDKIQDT